MTTARSLLLLAALAGLLAASNVTTAPAQPKDTGAKAESLGTVEIYEAKDGYRFRVKGLDGKVLAQPAKGYKTKEDCMKTLDTVKIILNSGKVNEVKK